MRTPKPTKADSVSRVLDAIPSERILNPEPFFLEIGSQRYEILPMPDSLLMQLGDEMASVLNLLDTIVQGNEDGTGFTPKQLMPLAPHIVKLLVPNATRIVAACLGLEDEFVAQTFYLHKKLEALRLIVEAENLPLILGNWTALVATFQTPEQEAVAAEGSTEASSTNGSPVSTDGPSPKSEA